MRSEQEILSKLDDELFNGKIGHYKHFSHFDNDKDGYVSVTDVRQIMRRHNYINEKEIDKLV